jgi:hypothetical protein
MQPWAGRWDLLTASPQRRRESGLTACPSTQATVFRRHPGDQEPRVLLTELNVPLMLKPSEVTTATQATTIKANITAYSTAVGPSSLAMKRLMQEGILFI